MSALPRRTILTGLCSGLAATAIAPGCKRKKDPVVPEVWDEANVPERAEALAKLAPPWPAPARATLGNGLLTYWLSEPDAPAAHVRLMFPDHDGDIAPALVSASLADALRNQVQRRLGRSGARTTLERRPGRHELVLHGPGAAAPRMLAVLADALTRTERDSKWSARLLAARAKVLKGASGVTGKALGTASTLAALLGQSLDSQRIDANRPDLANVDVLRDAWATLVTPSRCVLVVHAPQGATEAAAALAPLGQWGTERSPTASEQATGIARLRWDPPAVSSPRHLLVEGGAPLRVTQEAIAGTPRLVIGHRLATPTTQLRAQTRLGQRIAAETTNLGASISGDDAILIISTSLTARTAEERVRETVERLAELGRARSPQQRLFQSAQLWLGARVVQASLDGEDWTALWSESIDLAQTEPEIGRALAADAAAMLAVTPDELAAWGKGALDPRLGDKGWAWTLAGADAGMERQVARLTETLQVPATQ